jgi:ribonuclease HII
MLIAGVDDAGRGPIIGPLVIAGVVVCEKDLSKLRDLGVKDSKLLSPQKREKLTTEIKELAVKFHIESLSPVEIDKVVETGRKLHRLNRLEAQTMATVINALRPDVAYVDASDVLADRFGKHISENLSFKVKIISEHKADARYAVVSSASIIAKVERDHAIEELNERHRDMGELGSGYASDPRTIKFLETWYVRFRSYPEFVRKSWRPAKELKIKADRKQKKLV